MAARRRTRGMLVVNPRPRRKPAKRRAAAKRKTASRRRKNPTTSTKRRAAAKKAAATRRRKAAARSAAAKKAARTRKRRAGAKTNPRRASTRRRKNPARKPRRASTRRRKNPARKRGKAKTRVVYRAKRKNPRRRRTVRRRHNPAGGLFGGLEKSLKKLPVVGGLLAGMAHWLPHSLLGALVIEPTMWFASMVGPYVPQIPASLFYGLSGLVLGAATQLLGPKLGLSKEMSNTLSAAFAAAPAGVAYYKYRMELDQDMGDEVGLLELKGASLSGALGSLALAGPGMLPVGGLTMNPYYAGGMATSVQPYHGLVVG